MSADPGYLDIIEKAHRAKVGENFCYAAVQWMSNDLYRLAIVRKHEGGYYPISEDFFFGTKTECKVKSDQLNETRLGLLRYASMIIIASSMSAQDREKR